MPLRNNGDCFLWAYIFIIPLWVGYVWVDFRLDVISKALDKVFSPLLLITCQKSTFFSWLIDQILIKHSTNESRISQ